MLVAAGVSAIASALQDFGDYRLRGAGHRYAGLIASIERVRPRRRRAYCAPSITVSRTLYSTVAPASSFLMPVVLSR